MAIKDLKFSDNAMPSFSESSQAMANDVPLTANTWLENGLVLPLSTSSVAKIWRFGSRVTIKSNLVNLNMVIEAHLVQKTAAGAIVATHDQAMTSNAGILLTENVCFLTLTKTISVPANSTDIFYVRILCNQAAKVLKNPLTYFTATLVQ